MLRDDNLYHNDTGGLIKGDRMNNLNSVLLEGDLIVDPTTDASDCTFIIKRGQEFVIRYNRLYELSTARITIPIAATPIHTPPVISTALIMSFLYSFDNAVKVADA